MSTTVFIVRVVRDKTGVLEMLSVPVVQCTACFKWQSDFPCYVQSESHGLEVWLSGFEV